MNLKANNLRMIDLLPMISFLRPDICKDYIKYSDPFEHFLAWVVVNGSNEYISIRQNNIIKQVVNDLPREHLVGLTPLQHLVRIARPDVATTFPLPSHRSEFQNWFYTNGIKECGFWSFLTENEKAYALNRLETTDMKVEYNSQSERVHIEKKCNFSKLEFGVNIIGHAFGEFGVGEDCRALARSLIYAGIPVQIVNFTPGPNTHDNDDTMKSLVSNHGDYKINIFCLTVEQTIRFFMEFGDNQWIDRYNIGYWPWELEKWPTEFTLAFNLVDEIWASSNYTFKALSDINSPQVYLMPPASDIHNRIRFTSRLIARKYFGLPQYNKLFLCAFDPNSGFHRKNPIACISAFQKAFPLNNSIAQNVNLIIKLHNCDKNNPELAELFRLCKNDSRILLFNQTIPRHSLLAFFEACDCLVSLHRAEGFGRILAECLQLGLHVICTGYSGNIDFCKPPHVDLVKFKMVSVKDSDYVYTKGQSWADPNINHAAKLMEDFAHNRRSLPTQKQWDEFSLKSSSITLYDRINKICQAANN